MTGTAARRAGAAGSSARLAPFATVLLVIGPMLSMIDSAVVNVAIPQIARSLHTSLSQVQWTVSGYLLGLAVGQAVVAWLDRRFGTYRAYLASLVLFAAASLACAAAPGIGALITFRVLQGLVAAPLAPLALSLLLGPGGSRDQLPLSAGLMFFAAPAFGPVLGGLLVTGLGWRSVFLINPPLAAAGLAGLIRLRSRTLGSASDKAARFDLTGVALLATGLGLVTFAAGQGPGTGWLSPACLPYWATGACLLASYTAWAATAARTGRPPALNLNLLSGAQQAVSVALAALTSVVLYAVLVLAPVFLEEVQGRSAVAAGLVLLPQGVVMGLATALGNVLIKLGARRPVIVPASITGGLLLLSAFTLGLLAVNQATSPWLLAAILCGRGIAIGLTTQPLVFSLLAGLPPAGQADANTLFIAAERLAGSVGVALIVSYFTARTRATGSAVLALHSTAWLLSGIAAAGVTGGFWLIRTSARPARRSGWHVRAGEGPGHA